MCTWTFLKYNDSDPPHRMSTSNPDQSFVTTSSEDKGTTKRQILRYVTVHNFTRW